MRAVCVLWCLLLASPAWSQARAPAPRARTIEYALPHNLDARLVWSRGDVSVWSPNRPGEHHAAAAGEVLRRGARVRTARDGGAEIALRNGTSIELGPRTQVVMFAPPVDDPPDRPPSTTTSLRSGSLRFRADPSAPARLRLIPVATSAAIVYLGRGDGVLTADEGGHMTRIAMHRGRASVTARRGSFVVRAGRGTVQRGVQRPRPTHSLPPQPHWIIPPPARVVSAGGPVAVSALYGLSRGSPETWRVDVARDPSFRDLVSSTARRGDAELWLVESLPPGSYFVRVRAFDYDGLEGPPSPVAPLTVAAPVIARGHDGAGGVPGRASTVLMPDGFFCGLDGMNLSVVDAPIRLAPARMHSLRCASTADGRHAQDFTLEGRESGPLVRDVRLYTGPNGDGVLGLSLRGGDGTPVTYADVDVESDAGLHVDAVREADARGDYTASVRWSRGVTRARLRVTVNHVETFDAEVSRTN